MMFLNVLREGKERKKFFNQIATMSADIQRRAGIKFAIDPDLTAGLKVVRTKGKKVKESTHVNFLTAITYEETPLVGSAEKVAALMQAWYNYDPADIRELYKKYGWTGHRQLSKAFFSNFNMDNGRKESWQKAADFCAKYLGSPTFTGRTAHAITLIPTE